MARGSDAAMESTGFSRELAINRLNWDARARVHAASHVYGLKRHLDDPFAVSAAVEWDSKAIGSVAGLELLHLQCRIGTDTVSWPRPTPHSLAR